MLAHAGNSRQVAWDGRGFRLLGPSAAMADVDGRLAGAYSERGHGGVRQRAAMRLNLAYVEHARDAEDGEVGSRWGEAGAAGSARRSSRRPTAACLRPSSARPASARLPTSRHHVNGYGDGDQAVAGSIQVGRSSRRQHHVYVLCMCVTVFTHDSIHTCCV